MRRKTLDQFIDEKCGLVIAAILERVVEDEITPLLSQIGSSIELDLNQR